MSAIKDGRYPVMLDKKRHLLFSLNAIDELQDKFGTFEDLPKILGGKDKIKNIRWLLTMLINEGADDGEPELTEKQVGRLIHTGNFIQVQSDILKAFAMGNRGTAEIPEPSEDEDDEDDTEGEAKNAAAGRE
jgi:hypothetical protein